MNDFIKTSNSRLSNRMNNLKKKKEKYLKIKWNGLEWL
jgi:hypothetical protein